MEKSCWSGFDLAYETSTTLVLSCFHSMHIIWVIPYITYVCLDLDHTSMHLHVMFWVHESVTKIH